MEYPADLREEENEKLIYPFLPLESYDGISQDPQGATILLQNSKQEISLIEQRTSVQIIEKSAEKTAKDLDDA